jgi:Carboxypeptidase regulatory-like domain
VNSGEKGSRRKIRVRRVSSPAPGPAIVVWLSLGILAYLFPAPAQSQQQPSQRLTGSISGIVADQSGNGVAGARVSLTREDHSPAQEALTDDDGRFSFANIAPGPFQLTLSKEAFDTQTVSGILHSGETYTVPQIVLTLARVVTEVRVTPPLAELAKFQLEEEEEQRVLGVVPNFYVTYNRNTVALNSRQKFELAWKSTMDPVIFVLTGATAGIEQANNSFSGYGQGAQGYAKRYGASYADFIGGVFIGSALLPSILKQDPRYFYKGTGSKRSRFLYAIANSVICKGDNGHWQTNYSNILGSLAEGGISNLYYPAQNRHGVRLTFENTLIGIGTSAAVGVIQEFIIPKLTPNLPGRHSANP